MDKDIDIFSSRGILYWFLLNLVHTTSRPNNNKNLVQVLVGSKSDTKESLSIEHKQDLRFWIHREGRFCSSERLCSIVPLFVGVCCQRWDAGGGIFI